MIVDTAKLKRLWRYLKPYWHLELVTLFVMAVLAMITLALPLALQYMVDTLIPSLAGKGSNVDLTPVIVFGLVLCGIYFVNILISWSRDWLVVTVGANIIKDMRAHFFAHLQQLSLTFHKDRQIGETMSRLLSDVGRVQDLLTETLLMTLTNFFLLAAVMAYLLHTNWLLTLIAVIPVPLTVLATHKFGQRMNVLATWHQQILAKLSARLQESLLSIKTVKAFGQEKRDQQAVGVVLTDLVTVSRKVSVTMSVATNIMQFVNMIGPIIVLSWGVYLVATGGMKLGELIAFYVLLSYLYTPISSLAGVVMQVQTSMASVDRVFEYLDIPPTVQEDPNPIILTEARGAVELRQVTFSYEGSPFRIDKLSLAVQPKEKVAIVGPSGCGKTTIINLVMRFFDPESGEVLLDGIDLRKIALTSLRRQVSLVDQEPLLFSMSIRENIAYGKPEATLDEIISAAKVANIHDMILAQPEGYDTAVAQRGLGLSGGERQRLCLARAILTNPAVLILDEATSALDSQSEHLIQQALTKILKDKTAIIIAHRLSTVQHADRIVALENGKIIDIGRHEELTARCAMYRDLAAKQLLV